MERSPLIRHPSTVSSVTTGSVLITRETESVDGFNNNVISTENHQFIKDVSLYRNNYVPVNNPNCESYRLLNKSLLGMELDGSSSRV